MSLQSDFNAAYWASFPEDVQILNNLESFSDERMAKAVELAIAGTVVDGEIQARGMDPWATMKLREGYGYAWVPSLLQPPITLAPGIMVPGVVPYNPAAPPVGSIKVSSNIMDYPPFVVPVPPPTPSIIPAKPMFTIPQGPGRYSVLPGDTSPSGTTYDGPEGHFVKVLVASPFGSWAYWEAR